ncbi:MAG: hypothetical protein ABR587_09875 [Candidatus Binatia bacterium]
MKRFTIPFGLFWALLLSPAVSFADSDLSIYKTGPATVVAGTDIVYQISVYNAGPDPATGVEVSDVFSIPGQGEGGGGAASCSNGTDDDSDDLVDQNDPDCEGLVFLGATAPCSITGSTATEGTLDCTLGNLAVGESTSFTIKFHVTPAYLAKIDLFVINQATVSANETDPDLTDNSYEVETAVEEVSDLRITKLVEPGDSIHAGEVIYYTIWVDNYGPSAARNVTILDAVLSSGDISIQSCAFSVSQGGGAITQFTCTTGPLVQTQFGSDIGTFKTDFLYPLTPSSLGRLRASFRMVANTEIHITNTVRVTSDTFDPAVDNNYADVFLDVVPVADLATSAVFSGEVQVSGQPGLVVPTGGALPPMPEAPNYNSSGNNVTAGRRIEFTGSTTNAGPSPASNTMLEFLLPAGTSVLADSLNPNPSGATATGSCYTEPAGETRRRVICVYETLEVGDTAAARFQLLVDHAVPAGTQSSIDFVSSSDEFDPALNNNVGGRLFNVNNRADLSLQKFAIGSAVAGEVFHYEIQIDNNGPSTAHDVLLRDFLPADVTFVDAYIDNEGLPSPPLPCGVTSGSNALFCSLGDIPPTGAAPMLVFVNVRIDSDLADGTVLINSADVFISDTTDPVPGDNVDSADKVVTTLADVGIVKTADADIFSPSSRVTFILTVTNTGPSTAHDVEVIDSLPPAKGAEYLFDSGGCALAGTTLTCPVGTLVDGETRSFNVYMLIKGNKGKVTNTATVSSSTNDLNSDNNTSFKTVLVKGGTGGKGGSKNK